MLCVYLPKYAVLILSEFVFYLMHLSDLIRKKKLHMTKQIYILSYSYTINYFWDHYTVNIPNHDIFQPFYHKQCFPNWCAYDGVWSAILRSTDSIQTAKLASLSEELRVERTRPTDGLQYWCTYSCEVRKWHEAT